MPRVSSGFDRHPHSCCLHFASRCTIDLIIIINYLVYGMFQKTGAFAKCKKAGYTDKPVLLPIMIAHHIFKLLFLIIFLLYLYRINIDFSLISWGFGKFPQVLTMWFYMQAATLALYPAFILWIQYRHINPGGSFGFMVSISHLSTVLHLVTCT